MKRTQPLKNDKVEHVLLYHFLDDIFFLIFHHFFLMYTIVFKCHLKNDEK